MKDISGMQLPHTAPPQTSNTRSQTAGLSVAVVEENNEIREFITKVIASHGHDVVGLGCAEEIDTSASTRPIDMLIVDLHLPNDEGLSLVRRFRAAQPLEGVIILSSRHSIDDKVKGYNCGADIVLKKPVSTEELMAAINSIARRLLNQGTVAELAKLNQFSMDIEKLILSGPLGKVGLTDTETQLIAALSRAPGQRLETKQLMAILKLETSSFSKSAFEVRVVRLRKKLITVGADKLCIRSIRMQGYQLSTTLKIH